MRMSQGTRRPSTRTATSYSYPNRYACASVSREKSGRGDKVYYRLLTYDAPYNSSYPIDAEDNSLSFIYAARIPHPGLAQDYIHYICTREGIHHTRAKLYSSTIARRSLYNSNSHFQQFQSPYGRRTLSDDPAFLLAAPDQPLLLRVSCPGSGSGVLGYGPGPGSCRENPLVLYLDLDPSVDRTQAALPISRLEREGRKVAKVVRRVVGKVEELLTSCFGGLQKVPKGME